MKQVVKFRHGERVRYIGDRHEAVPKQYPAKGTVGTVISNVRYAKRNPELWVRWPEGSTSGDGVWLVREEELENAD